MTKLNENQGAVWPWLVGAAIGIGALVWLGRPKKAAAATTGTGPVIPPIGCEIGLETLASFGRVNNITIWLKTPQGMLQLTPLGQHQLVWNEEERVLRTIDGFVDEVGTQSYCAYVYGR